MRPCHASSYDRLRRARGKAVKRAFTLIELLVVIAIISVLAALLMPALSRVKEAGRGAACLSNLRQIGAAIRIYVDENGNRLPFMRDQAADAPDATSDPNYLPGPDKVLAVQLGNTRVLKCPSDLEGIFEKTGSSYSWNSALNGQNVDRIKLFTMEFAPHQIPLMFDKEGFHKARGPKKEQNILYGDGHIKNLLAIEGTINN